MKLEHIALLGGLAYLVLSRNAGASSSSTTSSISPEASPPATTAPIETLAVSTIPDYTTMSYRQQQEAKTVLYSDFSQFVQHIKGEITAAGFQAPTLSVPLSMAYDNKIRSQLLMPLLDTRTALERSMRAYTGSGSKVPYEMQQAYQQAKTFEKNIANEITQYFKTGKWS